MFFWLYKGLKNPSGKGKRLIILHIGSDNGFLDGGLLIFESKQTNDYHEEMNGEVFKEWFEGILSKLVPQNVIMDNAPYHSFRLYKRPNSSWRKQQIVNSVIIDRERYCRLAPKVFARDRCLQKGGMSIVLQSDV